MRREILARLANYLVGESSREQFEDWFIPATWDIKGTQDAGTVKLANRIKLRLAEFSNGDWPEEELKEELAGLLRPDLQVYRFTTDPLIMITFETSSTGHVVQVRQLVAA